MSEDKKEIRISAIGLLQLLSGEIKQDDFLEDQGFKSKSGDQKPGMTTTSSFMSTAAAPAWSPRILFVAVAMLSPSLSTPIKNDLWSHHSRDLLNSHSASCGQIKEGLNFDYAFAAKPIS